MVTATTNSGSAAVSLSVANAAGPLDLFKAIKYAQLVGLAEAVPTGTVVYKPGTLIPIAYGPMTATYTAVMTFFGNDLATEANPLRCEQIVSFGFVAQDSAGNVVVAIRGTEGIWEWVQDARFLALPCPILPGSGLSEDGFTQVYESLRVSQDAASDRLVAQLSTLAYPVAPTSLTICGHSLGGALATLFALDAAANAKFLPPTVYTYASPRVGDPQFASTYDQVVPNTYRVANRLDIVPKLPLPPLYEHVLGILDLNPGLGVRLDLACQHHLTTYLHLLSSKTGGPVLPLIAGCTPL